MVERGKNVLFYSALLYIDRKIIISSTGTRIVIFDVIVTLQHALLHYTNWSINFPYSITIMVMVGYGHQGEEAIIHVAYLKLSAQWE